MRSTVNSHLMACTISTRIVTNKSESGEQTNDVVDNVCEVGEQTNDVVDNVGEVDEFEQSNW